MPSHPADRAAPDERRLQISDVDVFYDEGAPKFLAADSLGVAVSP